MADKPSWERLREELHRVAAREQPDDPVEHARCVTEIARLLSLAFEKVGVSPVVVGGSALEIHAPGVDKSDDIDIVAEGIGLANDVISAPEVEEVATKLEIEREGRLLFIDNWVIDLVGRTLEGEPDSLDTGDGTILVLAQEDVIADRIRIFLHWDDVSAGLQAAELIGVLGDDLDWKRLEEQCLEHSEERSAVGQLRQLIDSGDEINRKRLQEIQEELT